MIPPTPVLPVIPSLTRAYYKNSGDDQETLVEIIALRHWKPSQPKDNTGVKGFLEALNERKKS